MTFPEINILVMAEDAPFDSRWGESLRRSFGSRYNIWHTQSIADGLGCLKTHPIDVLLIDLNLTNGQGMDSVVEISRHHPELAIVVLTPSEDGDTASDVQNHGAQDYLVKGTINSSLLHRSVRYAIERKKNERRLKTNTALFRSTIDSLNHPLMLIDGDSCRITMMNTKAQSLFCGILIPQGPSCGTASPILPAALAGIVHEVNTRQSVISRHLNVAMAEGGQTRLAFYGCPMAAISGSHATVLLYCHEITWLSNLNPDWPMLVTAMEQFPDAVIIMDDNHRIRYANPAFEALFGYSNTEIAGKNPILLIPVKRSPELDALIGHALNTKEARAENLVCRKKDLSLFDVKFRVWPVFDDLGRVLNIIAVITDVTGKKRMKSITEASTLTENLGSIFSGIRHEIGNPLNSIKMALTVLNNNLGHYPESTIQEFINRSLFEVERMEYLLKQFKSFSLFETPALERIRIDIFLREFIEGMREKESCQGISVHSPPTSPPEEIWGLTNPQALAQVLSTLTDNAIDALESTDQPAIRFRLSRKAGLVRLEVSDNGSGMTEEQQKNLFTPFTTTKKNGMGLGLVMVKKMLAKMDATIKIQSRPNAGTCVTLYLPTENR